MGRDPFVDSKSKPVPVSVSVKPPASQKWNWNRIRESGETFPYHGFAVETEKRWRIPLIVTWPGICYFRISKSLLITGFQHCQELNVSLTGLLNNLISGLNLYSKPVARLPTRLLTNEILPRSLEGCTCYTGKSVKIYLFVLYNILCLNIVTTIVYPGHLRSWSMRQFFRIGPRIDSHKGNFF